MQYAEKRANAAKIYRKALIFWKRYIIFRSRQPSPSLPSPQHQPPPSKARRPVPLPFLLPEKPFLEVSLSSL